MIQCFFFFKVGLHRHQARRSKESVHVVLGGPVSYGLVSGGPVVGTTENWVLRFCYRIFSVQDHLFGHPGVCSWCGGVPL